MSKFCLLFSIFFLSTLLYSLSAQDIVTDRPDQTESAMAVPLGSFQVETGTMIEIDAIQRNWVLNTTLFRYGVVKNLEFRLVTELINTKARREPDAMTGIADLQFGLKYQFWDGPTQVAYLGHLVVPTGNRNVSSGSVGMRNIVAIGHNLSDQVSIGYNIGMEYIDSENYAGIYALSTGIGLTKKVSFFAEVYGDWLLFDTFNLLFDQGFTWILKPNLQLDFSIGTGISSKSNFYSMGVSWLVPYTNK
jgi:hypothetical protein